MSTLFKNLIFLTVTFLLILPILGHADNSSFYGTYSLIYTEGSCSQQPDLTIGNDSNRIGEDGYLYIPSDVEFFVYEGIRNGDPFTNTIAVKGREILVTRFIKSASDLSKGYTTVFKMIFSANYKNGTITGNSTDDNLSGCQGVIKGTLKRN
ncbi:MAG: hypothetical protein HZB30_03105 [Nitrospirae bacterium]|nr:hypothetical protein [Nitrospirota bacterium]